MATTAINQKEYLKRYLSGGGKDGKKKKRKKTKIVTGRGLNIVDDNLEHIITVDDDEDETDLYELAENAPQVAGVFDDRPIHIQQAQDKIFGAKWKSLAADEEAPKVLDKKTDRSAHTDSDCSLPRASKHRDSDGDVSPPRNKEKKRHNSPPRRGSRDRSSPSKNQRHDSRRKDRNIRRRGRSSSSDDSQPRKRSVSSHSDESPLQSKNKHRRRSLSPSRKDKSRRDMSPVRSNKEKRRDRSHDRDKRYLHRRDQGRRSRTPNKKERSNNYKRKTNSDSDFSPHRKTDRSRKNARRDGLTSPSRRRKDSDSDQSPPRSKGDRRSKDFDRSQSRKGFNAGKNSDSDFSPPRRQQSSSSKSGKNVPITIRGDSDSDLSPPRLKIEPPSPSSSSRRQRALPVKIKQEPADPEAPKTLEGKRAGLQDARTLKAEMELLRKQEKEQFQNMADHISGRGATAVIRDRKTGRKRNLEEEEKETEQEKEAEKKRKEEFDRIGRGVVQEERRAQALEETLHEMSKPVARYAGDEDLERHLKAQEREGDPMLDYLRAKRLKENPELSKPAYKGPDGPPNRFNILPGHRWDGVDRSNGYEKKLFISRNAKEAQREESYKWSVADM
ncbi:BUD13 homolog [Cloeon dipterum]|uniref:BUD13 homolog n=1 Tax=Cloeon dipterum TaxID=197152 RepID=UPI00321F64CA